MPTSPTPPSGMTRSFPGDPPDSEPPRPGRSAGGRRVRPPRSPSPPPAPAGDPPASGRRPPPPRSVRAAPPERPPDLGCPPPPSDGCRSAESARGSPREGSLPVSDRSPRPRDGAVGTWGVRSGSRRGGASSSRLGRRTPPRPPPVRDGWFPWRSWLGCPVWLSPEFLRPSSRDRPGSPPPPRFLVFARRSETPPPSCGLGSRWSIASWLSARSVTSSSSLAFAGCCRRSWFLPRFRSFTSDCSGANTYDAPRPMSGSGRVWDGLAGST